MLKLAAPEIFANFSRTIKRYDIKIYILDTHSIVSGGKRSECLPSPFTYSSQTVYKTLDSFINWTCGKLSHFFSSATLIHELFLALDEGFKIALCITPQTRYIHGIKVRESY